MGLRNKVNKDGFISKEIPNVESKFYIDEQVHINHLAPVSGNQSITVNSDGAIVAEESSTFIALSSSYLLLSASVDNLIAPTQTIHTADAALVFGRANILTSVADGMTIPDVATNAGEYMEVVNAMAATTAVLTRSGADVVVNGTSATAYNLPPGETVILRAAATGTNVYIEHGGSGGGAAVASTAYAASVTLSIAASRAHDIGLLTGDISIDASGLASSDALVTVRVQNDGGRRVSWASKFVFQPGDEEAA
jgi:hypothetical protein